MKFMFTIYHDGNVMAAMAENERQALVDSAIEYAEELQRSGHFIASDALQRTEAGRTIRVSGGRVSTVASPFAETKEQLGGFYLIDVPDLDTALDWAAKMPVMRYGTVEVRPVKEGQAWQAGLR